MHAPGASLTTREHQQRIDAARSRWRRRLGVLAAGGVVGGVAGGLREGAREVILTSEQAQARAAAVANTIRQQTDDMVAREIAREGRMREQIRQMYAYRRRAAPPAPPRRSVSEILEGSRVRTPATVQQQILGENMRRRQQGLPPLSEAEQQARFDEFHVQEAERLRQATATRRSPFPTPPVLGTAENALVYDVEIDRTRRALRRDQRHLARMLEAPEFEQDEPKIREVRRLIRGHLRHIADLERLYSSRPLPTARRGGRRANPRRIGTRQNSRGPDEELPTHEVRGTVEQRPRGGETTPQIVRRRGREMSRLRAREHGTPERPGTYQRLEASTDVHIQNERERIYRVNMTALRDAMERGEIGSRILRATRRGGVIGAGIGMTVAGLGLLAHHVVTARRRRRQVAKGFDFDGLELETLEKALGDATAARLAAIYRRWIDRLLGRHEQPMNIADGLTEALAPGITQAFAVGATDTPIDSSGSDPRYRIDVNFDVLNPAVRRHMASYTLDRIVQISDAQREAIRQALMQNSVLQGIGPIDVARIIRQSIGLTAYQQAQTQAFRSQLVALDPRALERQLRDRRFDPTLKRAIDTGTPLTDDQVNAMEDAYYRRQLALRAETIARTESIRATSYGSLARAQEVLDLHPELDVIKIWHSTHDNRTRDTHVDLDGKQVQGMLAHWVTSHGNLIRWPFDEQAPAEEVINCRCYLEYRFIPRAGQIRPVLLAEAV